MATLIHLRHDLRHTVLGLLLGVDRSTPHPRRWPDSRPAGRARIHGPQPARECVCAPWKTPFAYAHAEGVQVRLEATEIHVRRPRAGQGGGWAFVSGKKKHEHHEGHRRGRPPRAHLVGQHGRAPGGRTTPPRCAPGASTPASAMSPTRRCCSTTAASACDATTRGRPSLHHAHRTRVPYPSSTNGGNTTSTPIRQIASLSSTPWPTTSARSNRGVGLIGGRTFQPPTGPSPGWSATPPRTPDQHRGRAHHASPAITHQLVRLRAMSTSARSHAVRDHSARFASQTQLQVALSLIEQVWAPVTQSVVLGAVRQRSLRGSIQEPNHLVLIPR